MGAVLVREGAEWIWGLRGEGPAAERVSSLHMEMVPRARGILGRTG